MRDSFRLASADAAVSVQAWEPKWWGNTIRGWVDGIKREAESRFTWCSQRLIYPYPHRDTQETETADIKEALRVLSLTSNRWHSHIYRCFPPTEGTVEARKLTENCLKLGI